MKLNFLQDVCFGRDADYGNIQTTLQTHPCSHCRFFPVRISSQGKSCFHYRDGFAVYTNRFKQQYRLVELSCFKKHQKKSQPRNWFPKPVSFLAASYSKTALIRIQKSFFSIVILVERVQYTLRLLHALHDRAKINLPGWSYLCCTVLNDQLISRLPKWLLIMSTSILYFL